MGVHHSPHEMGMMFTVGFISQDWSPVGELVYPNGCTWYRSIIPASALNSAGMLSHVGSAARSDNGMLSVRVMPPLYKEHGFYTGHDIIVLKLAMHIETKKSIEKALEKTNQKIVVDIDDFFDDLPMTNRAREATEPSLKPHNNRDIYFEIIGMAHALICSTQFLYDYYKAKHPTKPIFLVRNCIDVKRWVPRSPRRDPLTIGWVGATPWRGNDLEQLASFFGNYMTSKSVRFHHSGHIDGAPTAANLLGADLQNSTFTKMVSMLDVPKLYSNIDIGIVPLNNIDFNKAKSFLKGLEYACAGVPFVASKTYEYQLLADAGVGRIATDETEWISHFDELSDFDVRSAEAKRSTEIVRNSFSLESRGREWVKVFHDIMDVK